MAFNIFYNKDALTDLENINGKIPNDCAVILKKIENILTNNPFPFGQTIKKLKNIQPTLYRLRVNASISYRIFYRIIGSSIYIFKVVPKKDADRILKIYFQCSNRVAPRVCFIIFHRIDFDDYSR